MSEPSTHRIQLRVRPALAEAIAELLARMPESADPALRAIVSRHDLLVAALELGLEALRRRVTDGVQEPLA